MRLNINNFQINAISINILICTLSGFYIFKPTKKRKRNAVINKKKKSVHNFQSTRLMKFNDLTMFCTLVQF